MNRRDFLKNMAALAVAPGIIHAENAMKLWVPPEKKIITYEANVYRDDYVFIDPWYDESIGGPSDGSAKHPYKDFSEVYEEIRWQSKAIKEHTCVLDLSVHSVGM